MYYNSIKIVLQFHYNFITIVLQSCIIRGTLFKFTPFCQIIILTFNSMMTDNFQLFGFFRFVPGNYRKTVCSRIFRNFPDSFDNGLLQDLQLVFFLREKNYSNRGRKIRRGIFFKPNTLKKFSVFVKHSEKIQRVCQTL